MNFPSAQRRFVSFDGGVTINTTYRMPDRYRFWDLHPTDSYSIPRGAGLSYAAASFSAFAVTTEHARFNRILGFDAKEGTLEVEAGITLGEIHEFLFSKRLCLFVQPGHPKITVGGCAAADVHGKNQFRDGTFISQVRSLRLFHPAHGILELSASREPDLFALTCGGCGLTGNILTLKLAVSPISSPVVRVRTTWLPSAFSLVETLKQAASRADLVYSWHDFTKKGEAFGQGFVTEGSFVAAEAGAERFSDGSPPGQKHSLSADTRGRWRVSFFNRLTTPSFNRAYTELVRFGTREKTIPFYDFLFRVHDKEAYFKLFGRAGFHECQIIIPFAHYTAFVDDLRTRLERKPVPITLASAKLFQGRRDLLRFSGDGVCLAIDFPRSSFSSEFAEFLDHLVQRYHGRPNIIKDSRLPANVVAATYPEYELFRRRLAEFDPKRLYRSELAERLRLCG